MFLHLPASTPSVPSATAMLLSLLLLPLALTAVSAEIQCQECVHEMERFG